jgi:predicted SprT family Zn-dependent metalloprotease
MNLEEADRLCRELIAAHLGERWTFGWDRAVRRFGQCRIDERRITLSRELVSLNDVDVVRDTVLHEIAHGLAPRGAGHGPKWRQIARELGAQPERCFDRSTVQVPPPRHRGSCPSCGREVRAMRRRTVACARCCQVFNGGRYSRAFQIRWDPIDELERRTRSTSGTRSVRASSSSAANGGARRRRPVAVRAAKR